MNAYSSDLRERVIAAAQDSAMTQPEIAATFFISLSSVEAWVRTFRTSGRLKALPCTGGTKRVLEPHAHFIRAVVAQQPDATLEEICKLVAAQTGGVSNPSMMCRELQILQLPRKKVTTRQPARNGARANTARRPSRQDRGDATVHRRTSQIHR